MNRKQRRAAQKSASTNRVRPTGNSVPVPSAGIMNLIVTALQHDKAGRYAEAEQLCDQILAHNPNDINGLHLLGLVKYRTGRNYEAIDLFGRALLLNPKMPELHNNVGLALRALGRLDEATHHFTKALELRPRFVEAHNNIGIVWKGRGKIDEAIAAYTHAITLKPDYPEAHNNLGVALKEKDRLDEAEAALKRAIVLKDDYADAYMNLGTVLAKRARWEEAIAAYRSALLQQPNSVEIQNNLGVALFTLGRLNEAAACFQAALASRPNYTEAINNLGNVLNEQGHASAALAYFKRALALNPNYAEARRNEGIVLMNIGRLGEARGSIEAAIKLKPHNPDFYLQLGKMTSFSQAREHLPIMEEMARNAAEFPLQQQIDLHFAMGKAYADLKDYKNSFEHLKRGNVLKRSLVQYNEPAVVKFFERIEETFTPSFVRQKGGLAGDLSALPIFVFGMPRSGTTLVEQIISSHPRVHGAGELLALGQIAGQLRGRDNNPIPYPEYASELDGLILAEIAARYVSKLRKLAPTSAHVTDKTPANFYFAGLIHLALPNARIIHTIRNPIDTCLSCFSKLFTAEQNYTYDLAELGRYYRCYAKLMAHWKRVLPEGRILDVHYENVVSDLEGEARRLIAYCGLEWDPRCLSFQDNERPVQTASAAQVRQPIYKNAIGRWTVYREFLTPLLTAMGEVSLVAGA